MLTFFREFGFSSTKGESWCVKELDKIAVDVAGGVNSRETALCRYMCVCVCVCPLLI